MMIQSVKRNQVLEAARSVDDFLRILAPFNQRALAEMVRIKVDRPPYLFRGDKNDREQVASIGRKWRDDLDGRERQMLRHLREKFDDASLSDWDLVALIRHYGGKTRYLDWTNNALVALTFAIGEREGITGQPVVWVLETKAVDFDIATDEAMPFPRGVGSSTKIFGPSMVDSRIVRQDSYMMRQVFVEKNGRCEIEPVDVNPTFANRLWKIPIALDCRGEIAGTLNRLGYTMEALLPQINFEKLCMECNDIVEGRMT